MPSGNHDEKYVMSKVKNLRALCGLSLAQVQQILGVEPGTSLNMKCMLDVIYSSFTDRVQDIFKVSQVLVSRHLADDHAVHCFYSESHIMYIKLLAGVKPF
jgi:hypothetical protein